MPTIKLTIVNQGGYTLARSRVGEHVSLVYTAAYQPGDRVALETDTAPLFCIVQFEDSMPAALIYIQNRALSFHIPPVDNRTNYSPKSFGGTCHLITARLASAEEIVMRRCLSFNPYDQHGDNGFFPHASANVETRNEAVFAARNAIDGIFENASHGEYPYQSWGINRDPNAQLTIDFGRPVTVDEVRLTLRADFPHDNFWERATVEFSDGSSEIIFLIKTAMTQIFHIAPRTISTAVLKNLIMAHDPSPFPALTQIEVYGTVAL